MLAPSNQKYFEEAMQSLVHQHMELQQELTALHYMEDEFQLEEERYWSDLVIMGNCLQTTSEEKDTVQHAPLSVELLQLSSINIYLDTFIIGITQHGIGTINNLRLGKRVEEPVDWGEINAAWGQSVLLLHILAKKLGLTFSKYKPIPMGASPYVQQREHIGHGQTYPLYGSSAVTFSHAPFFYEFWGSSSNSNFFDLGMECFLLCVSELCARVVSLSSTITIPYYIDKDKIGTKNSLKSIKTTANNEINWSKALKYMLTNLKRILGYLPYLVQNLIK